MGEQRSGGHRARRRRVLPRGILAVVLVGVVAAGTGYLLRDRFGSPSAGDQPQCGDRVSIAADPTIAPALTDIVAKMPPVDCVTVGVRSVASAEIARDVARQEGKGLGGTLPNLWVPDSSLWIDRARSTKDGAARLVEDPESTASSPIVVAMAKPEAVRLGWPDTPMTWAGLVKDADTADGTRLGLTDLTFDAAAMASASAVDATSGSRLADLASVVALPRSVEISAIDLIGAGLADAAPSSEQRVFAAASDSGGPSLTTIYDDALGSLDYPLTTVVPAGEQPSDAVNDVRDAVAKAMSGAAGQQALSGAGFRDPTGKATGPLADAPGVDPKATPGEALADSADLRAAEKTWSTVSRRSRLLVLVDMSGSMGELLLDGTQRRDEAAQAGLSALVSALPPDGEVGLWGFTTLVGNGDYQVFDSLGPLAEDLGDGTRRQAILEDIDSLDAVSGGSTSLYDTVAKAYDVASKRYAFGKFNAVVVLTDGQNEDPGSITLKALVDRLQRGFDGTKPVRVITIAYGGGADPASLRRIADATGGSSFTALTEADIASTFASLATAE